MSNESFNTPPKVINKKRAVINWSTSTYGNIEDCDQPYYTYQGIGSLSGNSTSTVNGEEVK